MKKFRVAKPVIIDILILVFCAVWIAAIILNIFRWTGIFFLYSISLPFEITVTALSALVILLLLRLFFIRYTITEKGIALMLFRDMFGGALKAEKICKLVVAEKKLYVCFTNKKDEPQIARILIKESQYDDFIQALKELNPFIIVDDADIDK